MARKRRRHPKRRKRLTAKKRRSLARSRRRRLENTHRWQKREASRLGLSYRTYRKAKLDRQRASDREADRVLSEHGQHALVAHLFRTGQLY